MFLCARAREHTFVNLCETVYVSVFFLGCLHIMRQMLRHAFQSFGQRNNGFYSVCLLNITYVVG